MYLSTVYYRVFSFSLIFFLYSMISHVWQFNKLHKLAITSQVTFSFFVNFATVLEWIPLFLSHCLLYPFRSNNSHNREKSIIPFVPYGILFIVPLTLSPPFYIQYMIIDFCLFVNVYFRIAICTIDLLFCSSIFVYYITIARKQQQKPKSPLTIQ